MKLAINDFAIGDRVHGACGTITIIDIDKEKFTVSTDDEIAVLNKRELFQLLKGDASVFTHNCAQRLVCGQLGSVASRMALDDNQATTIDGTHKGAGMIKAQGQVTTVQYYFENQSWLFDNWFKKRGLTAKGYEPWEDPNADIDPSSINLGDDEDIEISKDKTEIDFNGIHREIDNTKDQKFEEI